MASFGKRTVFLTLSRFANYGLMVISPIILVRLLNVHDFGRYREFLVYSVILQTLASFSINDSLLYFVPRHPRSPWRVIRRTAALVAATSMLVVGGFVLLDIVADGAVSGGVLMGVGAKFARGCTSGQALSGGALLSAGSWIFIAACFATGYLLAPLAKRLWR